MTLFRKILVDFAVAVVVECVAGLGDVDLGLVDADHAQAVGRAGPGAVQAEVRVDAVAELAEEVIALVDLAVAVVVLAVADFVDRAGFVLAFDIAAVLVAGPGARGAEVRIRAVAGEVLLRPVLVHVTVTVVVHAVADLGAVAHEIIDALQRGPVGRAGPCPVLAEVEVRSVTGVTRSGEALVGLAVAVVVDVAVAELRAVPDVVIHALEARAVRGAGQGPVLAEVDIVAVAGLALQREALVRDVVAVVVRAVADLLRGGRRVAVGPPVSAFADAGPRAGAPFVGRFAGLLHARVVGEAGAGAGDGPAPALVTIGLARKVVRAFPVVFAYHGAEVPLVAPVHARRVHKVAVLVREAWLADVPEGRETDEDQVSAVERDPLAGEAVGALLDALLGADGAAEGGLDAEAALAVLAVDAGIAHLAAGGSVPAVGRHTVGPRAEIQRSIGGNSPVGIDRHVAAAVGRGRVKPGPAEVEGWRCGSVAAAAGREERGQEQGHDERSSLEHG